MGGKGSGRGSGGYRKNGMAAANDCQNVEPRNNARSLRAAKEVFELPDPSDYNDLDFMADRLDDVIDICERNAVRPMLATISSAMGMTPNALRSIAVGGQRTYKGQRLTDSALGFYKKTYDFFYNVWEMNLIEGGAATAGLIFLGKNYYGMRDQVEQIRVNVDAAAGLPSAEDVAERYAKRLGVAQKPVELEATVEDVGDNAPVCDSDGPKKAD
ncbi:hypothetical protein BR46_000951 [Adlercreutzia equolifaciens subsp. celatus DSM 18785]|nr:hypothetical protein [Adlercreutzia equolifaciens subsp. celatus DSM 18785]